MEIHDDFFDDLPEDILDFNSKRNIVPKNSKEKKKDKINAEIKIRSKFRQIKHQLQGLKDFDFHENDEHQKPEDIQRFI